MPTFLAVPSYDGSVSSGAVRTASCASADWRTFEGSALCYNYNLAWTTYLNERGEGDAFAMLHSDVEAVDWPGDGSWLDWMLGESARLSLACLSVVLPIKSEGGLTSVATCPVQDGKADVWRADKASLEAVGALPQTFTSAECFEQTGRCLLVNTGMMVVVPGPWAEDFGFRFHDRTVKSGGKFFPQMAPEDWNMSAWFFERGIPYGATTGVRALHHGRAAYSNFTGAKV